MLKIACCKLKKKFIQFFKDCLQNRTTIFFFLQFQEKKILNFRILESSTNSLLTGFTFKKKNVLGILFLKVCLLFRSNFLHDFIILSLKKRERERERERENPHFRFLPDF